MHPEDLAAGVRSILERTPAFAGKSLIVDIIANPKAGGFKRPRFAAARARELAQVVAAAMGHPLRNEGVQVRLHLTERGGHASAIAQRVIEKSESNGMSSLHLLLTAGGDGTSLETAERLVHLPAALKQRFAILRLPLGTGNDGSEGRDLVTALSRFLGPARFEKRAAVKVSPASEGGKLPLLAFNIASIGLDAYVAERTNMLKRAFPGDSYKFWVNVATLLYDKSYEVLPMGITAWNADGSPAFADRQKRLFVAMGSSGHRQYGSNKRILPGDENVIAVSQAGLLRKLIVKGPIEKGLHDGVREVQHFSASRLEIEYDGTIPLQCDGETALLARCDFPLTIELLPESYNVVAPAPQSAAGAWRNAAGA